jgi:preprotein translocase subunit SecA
MNSLQLDENVPIESNLLNKSLESAQKKVEAYYYDSRKQLFEYDEILNYQRQAIYSERRRILECNNLRDWILQYGESTISDYLNYYVQKGKFDLEEQNKLLEKVENLLGLHYSIDRALFSRYSIEDMREILYAQLQLSYDLKESQIDLIENGLMRELEKAFLLQKIDSAWKEHLQQITALRESIGWRGYGQKDPLVEYKNEAYNLFVGMTTNIRHSVIYLIFRSQPILRSTS